MDPMDVLEADLTALFRPYRSRLVATRDEPGLLSLDAPTRDAKGRPIFFGSVTRKPAHVSVHLFPLYVRPDLKDRLSPAFVARLQGKTCFNLRPRDVGLLPETADLIAASFAAFVDLGHVEPLGPGD